MATLASYLDSIKDDIITLETDNNTMLIGMNIQWVQTGPEPSYDIDFVSPRFQYLDPPESPGALTTDGLIDAIVVDANGIYDDHALKLTGIQVSWTDGAITEFYYQLDQQLY